GVYYVGLYAGFSLSLGVGTIADDILGWKWAYLLAALGGVAVAAVTFWTVPEPPPPPPPPPLVAVGVAEGHGVGEGEGDVGGGMGVRVAVALPQADGFSGDAAGSGSASFASNSAINTSSGFAYAPVAGDYPEEEGGGGDGGGGGGGRGNSSRNGRGNGGGRGRRSGNGNENGNSNVNGNGRRNRNGNGSGSSNGSDNGINSAGGARLRSTSGGLSPLLPPDQPPPPLPPAPATSASSPFHRFLGKLPDLSEAWLGSPSLLLVCIAGGVRDAGGFVFGYYMSSYFSPLMDGNAALTRHGGAGPCSNSFDAGYGGGQICNEAFPWCVDGSCSRLTGSPWHDVGMPPAQLEWFVSWVPLVGGSIGAMVGGFLSDRLAQV
ncbi:unnamed protein product, partial [Laminaria digitata]